jgi:hypothetical protein
VKRKLNKNNRDQVLGTIYGDTSNIIGDVSNISGKY